MVEGNSSSPVRTGVRTDIAVVCSRCDRVIGPGSGWLEVDLEAVGAVERSRREFDQRHATPGGGTLVSMADLMAYPQAVYWRAWHRDCDPDMESNSYYIDVERIATWRQVAEWTAHLMEKSWLPATNWDAVLRGLAHGGGMLREAAA